VSAPHPVPTLNPTHHQKPVSHPRKCDIIGDVRCVFDTNVLVAGMRSPSGASAWLLRAARRREVTVLLNVALALEYEAICGRAEHRLAAGLDAHDVGIFLDAVIAMAEPVETHFMWRPQLRDRNSCGGCATPGTSLCWRQQ
jgi:hypothetical protein